METVSSRAVNISIEYQVVKLTVGCVVVNVALACVTYPSFPLTQA